MTLSAYREVILSSKSDDEAAILAIFRDVFARETNPSISLLNIYKELPICNNATIFDFRGKNVEFKATPLQVAAIANSTETIVQAPFFNMSVIGRLVYLDLPHQLVCLGNFSYAEVLIDKRNTVRVKLRIPLNINLHADDKTVPGVVRDISLGGCSLTTLLGSNLETAEDLSLHIKIMHEGKVVEIDVPAKMVRIGPGPPHECALTFQHTSESERILSVFIYQRQLEIIRELREKS
ncbi:PilZ domain-containing protein [Geotalea sp. SG265]|uniref:PilZ domain-containing protein n=1 Tax=Geotalea sp. SG265 TaxID=2922867 RepID=UPI001FB02CF0|nr:PilZ domain-containing protein [Geotalea sp. SG265]